MVHAIRTINARTQKTKFQLDDYVDRISASGAAITTKNILGPEITVRTERSAYSVRMERAANVRMERSSISI